MFEGEWVAAAFKAISPPWGAHHSYLSFLTDHLFRHPPLFAPFYFSQTETLPEAKYTQALPESILVKTQCRLKQFTTLTSLESWPTISLFSEPKGVCCMFVAWL